MHAHKIHIHKRHTCEIHAHEMITFAGPCASSSNSLKFASEIAVVAQAFGDRGGSVVSLLSISRCNFFLILDTDCHFVTLAFPFRSSRDRRRSTRMLDPISLSPSRSCLACPTRVCCQVPSSTSTRAKSASSCWFSRPLPPLS